MHLFMCVAYWPTQNQRSTHSLLQAKFENWKVFFWAKWNLLNKTQFVNVKLTQQDRNLQLGITQQELFRLNDISEILTKMMKKSTVKEKHKTSDIWLLFTMYSQRSNARVDSNMWPVEQHFSFIQDLNWPVLKILTFKVLKLNHFLSSSLPLNAHFCVNTLAFAHR